MTTFGPTLRQLAANIFEKQVKIASIDQQVVAISNVDTVYARAVVDLSEHDVVLTIPEIDAERAHIFPFHDLYEPTYAYSLLIILTRHTVATGTILST